MISFGPHRSGLPITSRIGNRLLRLCLTAAYRLFRLNWLIRRPRTYGAHAVALTRDRELILVRLRYVPGWRLPGGGRHPGEPARDAVLRELREEIGMTSHGRVRAAAELAQRPDRRHDLVSLLVVEDVCYAPRWSLEVEQVISAPLDDLPEVAPVAREWLDAVLPGLEAELGTGDPRAARTRDPREARC
jgi:8-oxo-dGTP pyrophosphatase MutT (NUDIX family)